jgi:hypothetical protein
MMTKVDNKLSQFHHENNTWERMLAFFKQENSFLKNRLAEVLDQKTGTDFLALAEHFQNQFIIKDEFIDELSHDIQQQEDELKQTYMNDEIILGKRLIKKQEKLRNEMEYLEKEFASLKNTFNKYLVTII